VPVPPVPLFPYEIADVAYHVPGEGDVTMGLRDWGIAPTGRTTLAPRRPAGPIQYPITLAPLGEFSFVAPGPLHGTVARKGPRRAPQPIAPPGTPPIPHAPSPAKTPPLVSPIVPAPVISPQILATPPPALPPNAPRGRRHGATSAGKRPPAEKGFLDTVLESIGYKTGGTGGRIKSRKQAPPLREVRGPKQLTAEQRYRRMMATPALFIRMPPELLAPVQPTLVGPRIQPYSITKLVTETPPGVQGNFTGIPVTINPQSKLLGKRPRRVDSPDSVFMRGLAKRLRTEGFVKTHSLRAPDSPFKSPVSSHVPPILPLEQDIEGLYDQPQPLVVVGNVPIAGLVSVEALQAAELQSRTQPLGLQPLLAAQQRVVGLLPGSVTVIQDPLQRPPLPVSDLGVYINPPYHWLEGYQKFPTRAGQRAYLEATLRRGHIAPIYLLPEMDQIYHYDLAEHQRKVVPIYSLNEADPEKTRRGMEFGLKPILTESLVGQAVSEMPKYEKDFPTE
jgi:hypothetical protein